MISLVKVQIGVIISYQHKCKHKVLEQNISLSWGNCCVKQQLGQSPAKSGDYFPLNTVYTIRYNNLAGHITPGYYPVLNPHTIC